MRCGFVTDVLGAGADKRRGSRQPFRVLVYRLRILAADGPGGAGNARALAAAALGAADAI